MVDVLVKPLEWKELSTGWIAHTSFHAYEVVKTDRGFMATYANRDFAWGKEDAMKTAAQADFERRIRSTLSDAVDESEAEPVAWLYDWPNEYGSMETSASVQKIASVNRRPASNHRPLYLVPPTSELEALRKRVAELEKALDLVVSRVCYHCAESIRAASRVREGGKVE